MRSFFSFFLSLLCYSFSVQAQQTISVASWNLQNFGSSKPDAMIQFIANTIRDFDVVAIQEVLTGPGGAQAVGRLGDALNRTGTKWDYAVSDPTSYEKSRTSERYAFLWKTERLKRVGHPWLEQVLRDRIEREPFMITLSFNGREFTLASFHAVPKSKQPEEEIKYLRLIPGQYPNRYIIFLGDFNCPQWYSVFGSLKGLGYRAALQNQKTTLRQECKDNECLASEYDNLFFPSSRVHKQDAGIIPFYLKFKDMKAARKLSDHLPVYMRFSL